MIPEYKAYCSQLLTAAIQTLVTVSWYWIMWMCITSKRKRPIDTWQYADGNFLSHGRQLRSLQPARTLHTATRLQSMGNDVVLAATNSDALQRKVSHILLKADQAELLDELEERIQGSYFCVLLQTACCTTCIGHNQLTAT